MNAPAAVLEAIERRARLESDARQCEAIADAHAQHTAEQLLAGDLERARAHARLCLEYRGRAAGSLAQLDPETSGARP